jgi:recombination protein RecR
MLCKVCFNVFEPIQGVEVCSICQSPSREKSLLCVVEKETDLLSIENTRKYKGLYFVLGGTIGMMRKEDLSQLRLEEFKKRIAGKAFSEIIVALNPTSEGRVTSTLVESAIKETLSPIPKITHLARGIPVGGELEYADEETLESAIEGRK